MDSAHITHLRAARRHRAQPTGRSFFYANCEWITIQPDSSTSINQRIIKFNQNDGQD
jgi:hypothetical protein